MKTLYKNISAVLFIFALFLNCQNSIAQDLNLKFESSKLGPVYMVDGDILLHNTYGIGVPNMIAISSDNAASWEEIQPVTWKFPDKFIKYKGEYYKFFPHTSKSIAKSHADTLSKWSLINEFTLNRSRTTSGASAMISNGEMLWVEALHPLGYKSYNYSFDGDTWKRVKNDNDPNAKYWWTPLDFSGDSIIAHQSHPDGWSLWASADTGHTWNQFAHHDSTHDRRKIKVTSGNVYATLTNNRDYAYLVRYDMTDDTWTHISDGNKNSIDFDAIGDTVVVTKGNNEFSVSLDGGESWSVYQGGSGTSRLVYPKIIGSTAYIVGTYPFPPSNVNPVEGLYTFDLSNFQATSMDQENSNKPGAISLSQNYPNPFNPTTNIEFSLPTNTRVQLDVFNLLGQKVATLLDKPMSAGDHSTAFDASALNSGIYFYSLSTENGTVTKKMTLIK